MNNSISIPNKKKQLLGTVALILVLVVVLTISVAQSIIGIANNNLNGKTKEVTGTVENVVENGGAIYLTLKNIDVPYMFSDEAQKLLQQNAEELKGKTVTLVVPEKHYQSNNSWILGLQIDGSTVIDHNEVLQKEISANGVQKIVCIVLLSAMVVAIVVVVVLRTKQPMEVEGNIVEEMYRNYSQMFPPCPSYRKMAGISMAMFIVPLLTLMIATFLVDVSQIAGIVLFALSAVLFVAMGFGLSALNKKVRQQMVEFYKTGYPFDVNDISHYRMKEETKRQYQERLNKEYAMYPDTFGDVGNGVAVTFEQDGVTLTKDNQFPVETEVFDSVPAPIGTFVAKLTYDQLKFSAVALYKKHGIPVFVCIHSNIDKSTTALPEEIERDIHLVFDKSMLVSLKKNNVPVEGLQELLDNMAQNLEQNCL